MAPKYWIGAETSNGGPPNHHITGLDIHDLSFQQTETVSGFGGIIYQRVKEHDGGVSYTWTETKQYIVLKEKQTKRTLIKNQYSGIY